jgi:hypothetical protein
MILPCEYVAALRETVMQGGREQHTPTHAAVITFGFPSLSYVPTIETGVGYSRVLAPKDFKKLS